MNFDRKDIFIVIILSSMLILTVLTGLYIRQQNVKSTINSAKITTILDIKKTTEKNNIKASQLFSSETIVLRTSDNKNLEEIKEDAIIVMAGYIKYLNNDKGRNDILPWVKDLSIVCAKKKVRLIIVAPSYNATNIKKASWLLWSKGIHVEIYIAETDEQRNAEYVIVVKKGKIYKKVPLTLDEVKSKKNNMLFI